MNLKLLDKYILKQILGATFVCIALFMIVWLAPETIVNNIKSISMHEISMEIGLKSILFMIPFVLSKALPVGILLGCLYTFNRMSKDSELTVIRGCGIDFWRIMVMPIVLSIVFSITCFFVYDKMVPYSSNAMIKIKGGLMANHFVYSVKDNNDALSQLVIVKYHDNNDAIRDVIVLNFNRKETSKISLLSDIILSKNAVVEDYKWSLYDNTQYIVKYDGVFEQIKTPQKMSILNGKSAQIAKQLMSYSLRRDRELTNWEMKDYLRLLKSEDIDDLYNLNLNKYLQRIFHSAICILFAILGCLLGYSNPREQKLVGFTIAIGIIFLYYMSLPFFDLMAEKSILSPWFTSTIQPITIALIIYFYKKHKGL